MSKPTGKLAYAYKTIAELRDRVKDLEAENAELRAGQSCTAEPVAIEYQHEETGQIGYVDVQQVEWGFFENNPRLQEIGPLYRHPLTAETEKRKKL